MKRLVIIFFALSFILCLQAKATGKMNLMTTQTYPSLQQDSVRTYIVGSKSVTTFYVYAPYSSDYILRFWLMGVKHSDGNYSSYVFRIDQDINTQQVKTTRGDWASFPVYNTTFTYLSQGYHELHLEGTLDDVPNAERVTCLSSPPPFGQTVQTSDYSRYNYLKHHQAIPSVPVINSRPEYKKIDYFPYEEQEDSPAYYYTAELNKDVYYSFFRLEYYTAGQTVTYQTDVLDGVDHVLHVFSQFNDGQYSLSASSVGQTHISMTYTIPQTGFYYVLLRSYDPEEYGTCNLNINGVRLFEDIPICNSYTEVITPWSWDSYACFAKSNTGDPFIILMNSGYGGNIVKYNDDYPFIPSQSDYDWETNARINNELTNGQWLFTTSKSFPPYIVHQFDIFTRCKRNTSSFQIPFADFPNLKRDDIIYSSISDNSFNCISWAVGEWLIGYWLSSYWPDGIGFSVATLDSLFEAYGYTTSGATEANAHIDLWANVLEDSIKCSHASVKSKGNDYAASYDWESKIGPGSRIFHPRYALEGEEYGNVIAHYRKNSNGGITPIEFLNVKLSQQEIELIEIGASDICKQKKDHFIGLYEKCNEQSEFKVNMYIDSFEKIDTYKELLRFCIDNNEVKYLLFKG